MTDYHPLYKVMVDAAKRKGLSVISIIVDHKPIEAKYVIDCTFHDASNQIHTFQLEISDRIAEQILNGNEADQRHMMNQLWKMSIAQLDT